MTATRDQDLWQYALSLGYVDHGTTDGQHRKFHHPKTGRTVFLPSSYSDYATLRNGQAQLRQGAGTSKRGREAVVNGRRDPKPKKGANSARLEAERVARQREAYEKAAEQRYRAAMARPAQVVREQADLARARAHAAARVAEENFYRGLMRGV